MKNLIKNSDGTLTFRPFRSVMWIIPLLLGCLAVCYVMAVKAAMVQDTTSVLMLLLLSLPLPWGAYYFFVGGRITLSFEQDGMRITGGGSRYDRSLSWKDFSYVHYATDVKGGLIVILSQNPIDEKDAKRIVHSSSMLGRLRAESTVTIGMLSGTEEAAEIKRFLSGHLEHVVDYTDRHLF